MKKSTLLSLATAGAIVATSMGTFAAWDQLSQTTAIEALTINKPVVIEIGQDLAFTNKTLGADATMTSAPVTFTTAEMPANSKIKLTLVSDTNGTPLAIPAGAKVAIKKGDQDLGLTNGVAEDSAPSTSNAYSVEVTLDDSATIKEKQDLATSGLNIGVKAEIVVPTV